jgi:RND family efflux transporter MFP subunit
MVRRISTQAVRRTLTVALAVVALTACGKSDAPAITADSVSTMVLGTRDLAVVTAENIATGVSITGSLNPAQTVDVKSQIAGQLEEVRVDRGTAVRRGQLLTTINAKGSQAQLASAQAALAAAERDLRAADTLFKAGAISERDFVQAKVAKDAADAQVAQAQEALGRASVTAPITGVISNKAVESGEAVGTAILLFTIVNTDVLELAGKVSPSDIASVRVGQRAELTSDAYVGRTMVGRVARIEPVAEAGTRQVTVYVHVPNAKHEFVAGLFATGLIVTEGNSAPVPVVPMSAVRTNGEQHTVYVFDGTTINGRTVTLGARDASRGLVEVRNGLALGDRVLLYAPESVQNNVRVRLLDDSTSTQPAIVPSPAGDK